MLFFKKPARYFVSLALLAAFTAARPAFDSVTVKNNDSSIFYHGRWDSSPGTWWAGSGFNLHVQNLSSISVNLGPHTTSPAAAVAVSVNYGPFFTVNMSAGANIIPLDVSEKQENSVLRFNVEGWQNNRINLANITLNAGAQLLPYKPSKLSFQFIGDSLSAGQFLPLGVDQAWPFLVSQYFKAEQAINAQPGAALSDIVSYGNVHGISYQFFCVEDTGYYYTPDHNFTTPWNFAHDHPIPTHAIVHIGANDASQKVSNDDFFQIYVKFLTQLRTIYGPSVNIFVFTPWGWPNADGTIGQYYEGQYTRIVDQRVKDGDRSIHLVNTTGWVTWGDVFPENQHPNIPGMAHIAEKFQNWLQEWGLQPEQEWATKV